ncbi:MAG: prepilin-type N-terminal cleavage/methylation domain-containing protein, partial [Burkholderiaceae bacterium]|nr:prepilin-type N-terminal cleavage/methylation domain-containing protein [Burkholderiaceae bacterium]
MQPRLARRRRRGDPRRQLPHQVRHRYAGASPGAAAMRARRKKSEAGFTLLELMVALVAGLIAILAIYYMSSASAHHFNEQQRLAQSQMALRMATERIRRDVQRAGFTAVPNTSRVQTCQSPPGGTHMAAIEFLDNADFARLQQPASNPNLAQADRLRLFGNFSTGFKYMVRGVTGNTVVLQQNWQAFQASFGDPANYDGALFAEVFRPGRWVHLDNRKGQHVFSQITGVNAANRSFTINPAPQNSCAVSHDAIVTPLQRIEYAVVDETDPELTAIFANDVSENERGFGNSILVRREIDFSPLGAPIAGTTQVV